MSEGSNMPKCDALARQAETLYERMEAAKTLIADEANSLRNCGAAGEKYAEILSTQIEAVSMQLESLFAIVPILSSSCGFELGRSLMSGRSCP